MQTNETTSQTGASLLVELGDEAPALRRKYAQLFAAIAGDMIPFVCRWEDDALTSALGEAYSSTSAIQPQLMAFRTYCFRLFSVPPSEQARSVFHESVSGSSRATESLFNEMDLFISAHRRAEPGFRKLLLSLSLEIVAARKAVGRLSARLDAFRSYLHKRAEATESVASRQAIAVLLDKSLRVRQELNAVERLCDVAQQLQAACEDMIRSCNGLIELLHLRLEPAWQSLVDSATVLHGSAHPLSASERVTRVAECTAEYENWLEEAMRECMLLKDRTGAAQAAISTIRA